MPIFVARQIVRHRTAKLNEISGRYSILKDEFYEPDVSRMVKQSKDNKQGSSQELLEDAESFLQSFKDEQFEMYDNYEEYIQGGMAKEMARINLPLSIYTEWYWTIDLHNLFHFLKLRMDSHAQYEVRVYADAKYNLIKDIVPFACESFEQHVINGKKFSKDELDIMKELIQHEDIKRLADQRNWKESKVNEFLKKI
jgi:thymidylate synthase (FAD)